jgi:hypothetical protein
MPALVSPYYWKRMPKVFRLGFDMTGPIEEKYGIQNKSVMI